MKTINRKFHPNYSRCEIHIHKVIKERMQVIGQLTNKSYSELIEDMINNKYVEVLNNDSNRD